MYDDNNSRFSIVQRSSTQVSSNFLILCDAISYYYGVRKLFERCFPFEVVPVSVPEQSSVRETVGVIWKTKTKLISMNSKFIFFPILGLQ